MNWNITAGIAAVGLFLVIPIAILVIAWAEGRSALKTTLDQNSEPTDTP